MAAQMISGDESKVIPVVLLVLAIGALVGLANGRAAAGDPVHRDAGHELHCVRRGLALFWRRPTRRHSAEYALLGERLHR